MKLDSANSSQLQGKKQIVAAIPCFNEERFIGSVVLKARKYVDKVIVVDDGSTDATGEIAEAAGAQVIRHKNNEGKGVAIRSAFEWAKEAGCSMLVLLDGDGQHDPSDIPTLVRPVLDGQADMVVGSRFLARTSKIPQYRRAGQQLLTLLTNVGSKVRLTDSQSGFRAFSCKAINEMSFAEGGMSVESEMQFSISRSGLKVTEVPIGVAYVDKAKRNPVGHGINVLSRVLVMFSLRQPLLLFGLPGLVLLICGLVLGTHVLSVYNDTHELAVGNGMITVILCLSGLLAMFTGVMLQSMKELMQGSHARPDK